MEKSVQLRRKRSALENKRHFELLGGRGDGKSCGHDADNDGCKRAKGTQDILGSRVLVAVAFARGAGRLGTARSATRRARGAALARGRGRIWVRRSEWLDFERFRSSINLKIQM